MEPDAQHDAMVIARFWIIVFLILSAGCLRAGEVVVAVPLSMQPYFLPIQGGGLAYDMIRAAFAAQGYSVRPLYVSGRQIEKLITGDSRVDCVPMISSGSEHGWHVTEHVHLLHDYAITRPEKQVASLGALRHGRVLAYSGALADLGDEFRSVLQGNPQYREINNHRAQVRLLLQGSVEVIIADRLLASWYLDYLHEEGTTKAELAFHDLFEPVTRNFVCRSPEIAGQFSAGLERIIKDGTLAQIQKRYGAEGVEAIIPPGRAQAVDPGRVGSP